MKLQDLLLSTRSNYNVYDKNKNLIFHSMFNVPCWLKLRDYFSCTKEFGSHDVLDIAVGGNGMTNFLKIYLDV